MVQFSFLFSASMPTITGVKVRSMAVEVPPRLPSRASLTVGAPTRFRRRMNRFTSRRLDYLSVSRRIFNEKKKQKKSRKRKDQTKQVKVESQVWGEPYHWNASEDEERGENRYGVRPTI